MHIYLFNQEELFLTSIKMLRIIQIGFDLSGGCNSLVSSSTKIIESILSRFPHSSSESCGILFVSIDAVLLKTTVTVRLLYEREERTGRVIKLMHTHFQSHPPER